MANPENLGFAAYETVYLANDWRHTMSDLDPNYVWSRFRTKWLRTIEAEVDEMIRVARTKPEFKPITLRAVMHLADPALGVSLDSDTSYALKWVTEEEDVKKESVPEAKF